MDDLDVEQAANRLLRQHGDRAAAYAAQWAAAFLEAGNLHDARKFERISEVLRTLKRRPRGDARARRSPRARRL